MAGGAICGAPPPLGIAVAVGDGAMLGAAVGVVVTVGMTVAVGVAVWRWRNGPWGVAATVGCSSGSAEKSEAAVAERPTVALMVATDPRITRARTERGFFGITLTSLSRGSTVSRRFFAPYFPHGMGSVRDNSPCRQKEQ